MSTIDLPEPQPDDLPWPTAPPGAPGLKIGFPGAHEVALPAQRFTHRLTILMLLAGLGTLTLTLIVVALLATPGPTPYCPPLKCQGPPIGPPRGGVIGQSGAGAAVESGTLYTNPTYGFSLRFYPQPSVATDSSGIGLTYSFQSGTADLDVLGGSAGSTSPQSAVDSFVSSNFPNASLAYVMPQPLVGYQPGYGLALNVQPASSNGSTQMVRVFVMAASSNGVGVIVLAYGSLLPPVTPSSQYFNGHPSPADVNLAYFYGTDSLINSITFPSG